MHRGGNGWVGLHYFPGDGQIITEIDQGMVETPRFLVIFPDSGNLNISINSKI